MWKRFLGVDSFEYALYAASLPLKIAADNNEVDLQLNHYPQYLYLISPTMSDLDFVSLSDHFCLIVTSLQTDIGVNKGHPGEGFPDSKLTFPRLKDGLV